MELAIKNLLIKALIAIVFTSALLSNAYAENMKKLGKMNVHYMAIGSTFFSPEIAKAYGITRSRYNGLINISVLDNSKDGNPVKAVSIMGKAKNNLGQVKSLSFQKVTEGKAIYYLAQVNYRNEETLHFDIMINDGTEKKQLKFSQTFYTD